MYYDLYFLLYFLGLFLRRQYAFVFVSKAPTYFQYQNASDSELTDNFNTIDADISGNVEFSNNFSFVYAEKIPDNYLSSQMQTEFQRPRSLKDNREILKGRTWEEYEIVQRYMTYLDNNQPNEYNKSTSKKVFSPSTKSNGLFETDIVLTPQTAQYYFGRNFPQTTEQNLNSILPKKVSRVYKTWKDTMSIRYKLEDLEDPLLYDKIIEAIYLWQNLTCVRFQAIPDNLNETVQGDHLVFFSGAGCWSYIGKTGGEQTISITTKCAKVGEIAHEIGHALGLWHEQSRPDRDFYVEVQYQNLENDAYRNFAKVAKNNTKILTIPYDLSSIMHYDPHALSKNEEPTLKTLKPRLQPSMGNREYLTFSDAKAINEEYCPETCDYVYRASKCYRNGYPNPNNCTQCLCPDGFNGGPYCDHLTPHSHQQSCGKIQILSSKETPENHIYVNHKIELTNSSSTNVISDNNENVTLIEYVQINGTRLFEFQCTYLIKASLCEDITLEVTKLHVPGRAPDNVRCLNWVEIRTLQDLSQTGERLCGTKLPKDAIFSAIGQEMLILIRFHRISGLNETNITSDENSIQLEFEAKYKISKKEDCQNPYIQFAKKITS